MATDPYGRDMPSLNADDLLGPTKAAGGGSAAVDGLKASIDAANANQAKLSGTLQKAVNEISGLAGKMSNLEKSVSATFNQAVALMKKLQSGGGGKGRTVEGMVTKTDLNNAIKRIAQNESPGLKQLVQTVTSPNSVAVRDKELRRTAGAMLSSLQQIEAVLTKYIGGGAAAGSNQGLEELSRAIDDMHTKGAGGSKKPAISTESVTEQAKKRGGLGRDSSEFDGMQFVDRYAANYFKGLRRSRGLLQEHLAKWIETGKHTSDSADAMDQHILALRKGLALKNNWRDIDKMQVEHLELLIKQSEEGVERNRLMEKYVEHIEKANERVKAHSSLWGKIKKGLWEGIKGAIVKGFAAVEGALNSVLEGGVMEAVNLQKGLTEDLTMSQELGLSIYAQGTDELVNQTKELFKQGDLVDRTGQRKVTLEKAHLKIMEKGFKNQKRTFKLAMQSGKLATEIKADTQSTSEMLSEWSRHLNLSNLESTSLARNITEAAKQTGLMGSEMLSAAAAAKEMVMHMRNLGKNSQRAMRNIVEMSAAAQKYGVGQEMGRMTKAFSSMRDLHADPQMLTLVAQAGVDTNEIGRLLSDKTAMKDFAERQDAVLRGYANQFGADPGAETTSDAIASMSEQQLDAMNFALKPLFGMEAGQMDQTTKALREASMTFGDRMAEIDQRTATATTQEQKERLAARKEQMEVTEVLSHLAPLERMAKEGDEKGILKAIKRDRGAIEQTLRGLGKDVGEDTSTQELLDGLTAAIGADSSGDMITNIEAALKAQEKREIENAASTDETVGTLYDIRRINEDFRNTVTGQLEEIIKSTGSFGMGLLSMSSQLGSIVTGILSIGKLLSVSGGIKAATSTISSAGGSVVSAAKKALSFVSFGLLDEGTAKIASGGMAHLHEGEMVIPKKYAEPARTTGKFEGSKGTGIWEMIFGKKGGGGGRFSNESAFGMTAKSMSAMASAKMAGGPSMIQHVPPEAKMADGPSMIQHVPPEAKMADGPSMIQHVPPEAKMAGGGMAHLHEGEMVIPKKYAEPARTTGKFEGSKGGGIWEMILGKKGGGILGGALNTMMNPIGSMVSTVTSAMNGIFSGRGTPGEIVSGNEPETVTASPKVPGESTSGDKVVTKLREERAGTVGKAGSGSLVKDMSGVEHNTADMLAALQDIKNSMSAFIDIIGAARPNESDPINSPGDPRANKKPMGNFNYYTWNTSKHLSNATKGPVSESSPT